MSTEGMRGGDQGAKEPDTALEDNSVQRGEQGYDMAEVIYVSQIAEATLAQR